MPRIVPIGEIKQMSVDTIVPALKGTVKEIYERKSGNNTHGDWSIEKLVVTDGQETIMLSLKNRPPFNRSWKGREIFVYAHQKTGKGKGALTGVKVDEYNGKVEVSITESAEIALQGASAGSESEPTPKSEPEQTRTSAQQSRAAAPPATDQAPVKQAGKFCTECGTQTDGGYCRNKDCKLYVDPNPKPKPRIPMGQTVGMALNNACASMIAEGIAWDTMEIFNRASDVLRVSYNLELGHLAPPLTDRKKQALNPPGTPPVDSESQHPDD